MTARGLLTLTFAGLLSAGVVAVVTVPAAVRAQAPQSAGGIRVATVEVARIFNEMQEGKDLRQRAEAQRARLMAQQKEKQDELETLRQSRAQFKPDHPQFEEINRKLARAVIEYKNWGEYAQLEFERDQKRLVKARFEKIQAAVAEVAQRDGIDLVLSSSQPEFPDDLDRVKAEDLSAIMRQRNVLFTSPRTDLTEQVLALLDAKYKAAGGANAVGAAFNSPNFGGGPVAAPAGQQQQGQPLPAGARQQGGAVPQQPPIPQQQQQQPRRQQP